MHEGQGKFYLNRMVTFIDVNGARLAYSISDNDATKPLFITLHGGRGFGERAISLHAVVNKVYREP